MALLELNRDSGYADHWRTYSIVLDGEKVCEIRDGETKVVSISSGQHSVAARIDWGGSGPLQFSAVGDETVTIHV